jgi:hypothetical protein
MRGTRLLTLVTIGALSLTLASGTALAAPHDDEVSTDGADLINNDVDDDEVSTDGADLINGNNQWNYDVEGSFWDYYNGGEDLTIFVHGFLNGDDDAILLPQAMNAAYECDLSLQNNGHDEFVVCYSWDSDKGRSLDVGWSDAKDIADRQGRKLGNFIKWWSDNVGTNINIVCHSLGARVVGSTLNALRTDWGAWRVVDNVALLGGAIYRGTPAWDGDYGYDMYYSANQTYNFHSYNDGVLDYIYDVREWGDALGEEGSSGNTPGNFEDINVSSSVGTHFDYYQRNKGCMHRVGWRL